MCQSMSSRDRKLILKLGGRIRTDQVKDGRWTGFMQTEKLSWWEARLHRVVPYTSLDMGYWTEHGHVFQIPPNNKVIFGILAERVHDHLPGSLLLLTRPARTREELTVHPRHPFFMEIK